MRIGRKLLLWCMIAGSAACAQGSSGSKDGSAASELVPAGRLEWSPVEAATTYRVQVWDGLRLLFEEEREDPGLVITPSLRRSLEGVHQAELRVQALGADGAPVGDPQVRTIGGARE